MRVYNHYHLTFVSETYRDEVLQQLTTFLSDVSRIGAAAIDEEHGRRRLIENNTDLNMVAVIAPAYSYQPECHHVDVELDAFYNDGAGITAIERLWSDIRERFSADPLAEKLETIVRASGFAQRIDAEAKSMFRDERIQHADKPWGAFMNVPYRGDVYPCWMFADTEEEAWLALNSEYMRIMSGKAV